MPLKHADDFARHVFENSQEIAAGRRRKNYPPHSQTLLRQIICPRGQRRFNVRVGMAAALVNRGLE